MPLVSMRQLLDHAAEHGYALPAFHVNNLEQVQAIRSAASEVDSPVIMQASAGARKYAGENFLRPLIEAAAAAKRAQTHCKRGHELSGDNLYRTTQGKRGCKECRKLHKRNHRAGVPTT